MKNNVIKFNKEETMKSVVSYYRDLNWFVIPLKYGTKQPMEDDWNDKPLSEEVLQSYATASPINIGVLLGKRVIDIDLDCEESRHLAPFILPETATFGRESTPKSHFVYTLSSEFDADGVKIKQWRMPKSLIDSKDKAMILELRGLTKSNKYSQTMFPPSVHPSGEQVKWDSEDKPKIIDSEDELALLMSRLRLLVMSSVISKCWDEGVRDDLTISFTALLLKSDYSRDEIIAALTGIMDYNNDSEMKQRLSSSVNGTILRHEEGEPVAGMSRMKEILTDDVFQTLRANSNATESDIAGLMLTAKGGIAKTTENLSLIFHHDPQLKNLLAVDSVTEGIVYTGTIPEVERYGFAQPRIGDEYQDGHQYMISVHIANKYGIAFGPDRVEKVMIDMAYMNNKVNFLTDRIKSCKWDGVERIGGLFNKLFGAKGPEYSLIAKAWFRSAVQRAFEAGCPMGHMLILKGNQGCGKSAFTNIIAFDNPEWHSDFSGSLDNTEAQRVACSKWVIELSELSSFKSTKDHNSLKSFITRMSDDYRMLYKNKVTSHPRTCVFIGTTNDDNFLTDKTGNRRYWIVEIDEKYNQSNTIDLEWLMNNRDQIWAEAYQIYKNVSQSEIIKELQCEDFLDRVESTQGNFSQEDKFSELEGILEFISDKFAERGKKPYITTVEFCVNLAGMDISQVKPWDMNAAADIYKRYGLKKVRRMVEGRMTNMFVPTQTFNDIKHRYRLTGTEF